jgi:hypothetical protein
LLPDCEPRQLLAAPKIFRRKTSDGRCSIRRELSFRFPVPGWLSCFGRSHPLNLSFTLAPQLLIGVVHLPPRSMPQPVNAAGPRQR